MIKPTKSVKLTTHAQLLTKDTPMAAKLPSDDRPAPAETSEPVPPDVLPRAVPRDKKRGGYDCEFVEPPPSMLQTECSVCL